MLGSGFAAEIENGEGPGKVSYASLKTERGCNALHFAAAEGKTQMCRYLIQKLNFDINAPDHNGTIIFSHVYDMFVAVNNICMAMSESR